MPFTHISEITAGARIRSGWFLDLYNVLTGVMTDQPLTIANSLTVTGTITAGGQVFQSANASSVAVIARGVSGQTADIFEVQDFQDNILIKVTSAGALKAEGGIVVDAGGLSIVQGGETITAGGLVVSAGNISASTGFILGSPGTVVVKSAAYTAVAADAGTLIVQSSANAVTLPAANSVTTGTVFEIKSTIASASVARAGSDTLWTTAAGVTTLTLNAGDHARLRTDGVSIWYLV